MTLNPAPCAGSQAMRANCIAEIARCRAGSQAMWANLIADIGRCRQGRGAGQPGHVGGGRPSLPRLLDVVRGVRQSGHVGGGRTSLSRLLDVVRGASEPCHVDKQHYRDYSRARPNKINVYKASTCSSKWL